MSGNARYNGKETFAEWQKEWQLEDRYNFRSIEAKWQKIWNDEKAYKVEIDHSKPKFYALVEFPYPSGAGLHVGHPRSYTALDVVSRKKRMQGFNVLYPMGFDAFGLPAENYAIKTGVHPAISTKQNIENFTRQLKSIGFSFDWDRSFATCDPEYYKWTQWMFIQLWKHGLAYKSKMAINWCPSCKVGLANEEVVNGCCERCGAPVVRRDKEQWMVAITKYADRLIDDLKEVDFIDRVRSTQINWIGRSEGAELSFELTDNNGDSLGKKMVVYTTRPDTTFGVTYTVMAPEHEFVKELMNRFENAAEVQNYIDEAAKKSELQRTADTTKTGVELKGIKAKNPFTGKLIPVVTVPAPLWRFLRTTSATMILPKSLICRLFRFWTAATSAKKLGKKTVNISIPVSWMVWIKKRLWRQRLNMLKKKVLENLRLISSCVIGCSLANVIGVSLFQWFIANIVAGSRFQKTNCR